MSEIIETPGIVQARAFIERLKDSAFRKSLRVALLNAREGEWTEIAKIGASAGYVFSGEELKQVVPIGFFKGAGALPDKGWDVAALAAPAVDPPSP